VLSREEVSRLIDAAGTLFRRTLLMTLHGTGMRRAELARLKVSDIDSQRMIIRVVAGKGGKDCDLPLSSGHLAVRGLHGNQDGGLEPRMDTRGGGVAGGDWALGGAVSGRQVRKIRAAITETREMTPKLRGCFRNSALVLSSRARIALAMGVVFLMGSEAGTLFSLVVTALFLTAGLAAGQRTRPWPRPMRVQAEPWEQPRTPVGENRCEAIANQEKADRDVPLHPPNSPARKIEDQRSKNLSISPSPVRRISRAEVQAAETVRNPAPTRDS
jgi:hypothetical protein